MISDFFIFLTEELILKSKRYPMIFHKGFLNQRLEKQILMLLLLGAVKDFII